MGIGIEEDIAKGLDNEVKAKEASMYEIVKMNSLQYMRRECFLSYMKEVGERRRGGEEERERVVESGRDKMGASEQGNNGTLGVSCGVSPVSPVSPLSLPIAAAEA